MKSKITRISFPVLILTGILLISALWPTSAAVSSGQQGAANPSNPAVDNVSYYNDFLFDDSHDRILAAASSANQLDIYSLDGESVSSLHIESPHGMDISPDGQVLHILVGKCR